MNFGQNVCLDQVKVRFSKCYDTQVSITGPRVICPPLSIFWFPEDTWININRFSPSLVCTLILSGLGLLMGNFCLFLTVLSARHCLNFLWPTINWVNVNGFSSNLICILILWMSDLGLLGWDYLFLLFICGKFVMRSAYFLQKKLKCTSKKTWWVIGL